MLFFADKKHNLYFALRTSPASLRPFPLTGEGFEFPGDGGSPQG